jgi:integrase
MKKSDLKASFPLKVSTNWARHTWATIARNDCRINKDDVALCMGHEDIDNRVTDIYIRYDYSIIDESNRKVLDLVAGTDS